VATPTFTFEEILLKTFVNLGVRAVALLATIFFIVACTNIYLGSSGEQPINIQTTDTTSVLSSVNVTSADKATKGDSTGHVNTDSDAKTSSVIPISTAPIIPQ